MRDTHILARIATRASTIVLVVMASAGPLAVDAAAAAPDSSGSSPPAPLGAEAVGTWWQQGVDQYTPSNLWHFDPVTEAVPYGWRKGYQPTGTVTPYGQQFSFTYSQDENNLDLSFPSGTRQVLTLLDYDPDQDVLTVNYEGYVQEWVGCRSGQMPALAAAACR